MGSNTLLFTTKTTGKVLGVLGGGEGLVNNLDGTFLSSETLVADQASQIWYRSEEDANGCSFLRNCNCENCDSSDTCEGGKLFTFLQRSGTQRFEGDAGNFNFDGGFPVINSKSNTINNELSCFGPHVHPSGSNGFEFKIYQPFEGPTIRKLVAVLHQGMRYEFGSASAGASCRALDLKTADAHSTRSLKISGCKR